MKKYKKNLIKVKFVFKNIWLIIKIIYLENKKRRRKPLTLKGEIKRKKNQQQAFYERETNEEREDRLDKKRTYMSEYRDSMSPDTKRQYNDNIKKMMAESRENIRRKGSKQKIYFGRLSFEWFIMNFYNFHPLTCGCVRINCIHQFPYIFERKEHCGIDIFGNFFLINNIYVLRKKRKSYSDDKNSFYTFIY